MNQARETRPEEKAVFDLLATRQPDAATGLSPPQHLLLQATPGDWTRMPRVIGNVMAILHDAGDRVGDRDLQKLLMDMTALSPARVEIRGTGPMRTCTLRLTVAGATLKVRQAPQCPHRSQHLREPFPPQPRPHPML